MDKKDAPAMTGAEVIASMKEIFNKEYLELTIFFVHARMKADDINKELDKYFSYSFTKIDRSEILLHCEKLKKIIDSFSDLAAKLREPAKVSDTARIISKAALQLTNSIDAVTLSMDDSEKDRQLTVLHEAVKNVIKVLDQGSDSIGRTFLRIEKEPKITFVDKPIGKGIQAGAVTGSVLSTLAVSNFLGQFYAQAAHGLHADEPQVNVGFGQNMTLFSPTLVLGAIFAVFNILQKRASTQLKAGLIGAFVGASLAAGAAMYYRAYNNASMEMEEVGFPVVKTDAANAAPLEPITK